MTIAIVEAMRGVTHLAASVILARDEGGGESSVLMQARDSSMPFAAGELCFPGGGMELADGDDLAVTAARELAEEEGIEVDSKRLEATSTWITPTWLAEGDRKYYVQYYYHDMGDVEVEPMGLESQWSDFLIPQEAIEYFKGGYYLMASPTWWLLKQAEFWEFDSPGVIIGDRLVGRGILDEYYEHLDSYKKNRPLVEAERRERDYANNR